MSEAEDVLKLLEDGKWHDLKEIREKSRLQDLKFKSIAKFLVRYNLAKLDKTGQRAKLNDPALDFLKKIRQVEGKDKP